MKRIILSLSAVLFSATFFAQVGINTTEPKSTLHVLGTNDKGAVAATDGVLVPRVNALGVDGEENGQLVYLIADDATNNFSKGFHYWDGSTWQPINDISKAEIRLVGLRNIISSTAGENLNGTQLGNGQDTDNNASTALRPVLNNLAIGSFAGSNTALENDNTLVGTSSGSGATMRASNTATGSQSLLNSTIGSLNIAIGSDAGRNVDLNNGNIMIGDDSGQDLEGSNNNVLIGTATGKDGSFTSSSVIVGNNAGLESSTGFGSTFIGGLSGNEVLADDANTAVGYGAASFSEMSEGNQFIGYNAGRGASSTSKSDFGIDNTLIGSRSGFDAEASSNNIFLGTEAGSESEIASDNIIIGRGGARGHLLGSNNILIGRDLDFPAVGATADNQLNIQNIIFGINNSGIDSTPSSTGKIGIGRTVPTERLDVDGTVKANNIKIDVSTSNTINATKGVLLATGTVVIPTADASYNGKIIHIKNTTASGITIDITTNSQTLDGSTSNRFIPAYDAFVITSDGTNWWILSEL